MRIKCTYQLIDDALRLFKDVIPGDSFLLSVEARSNTLSGIPMGELRVCLL